MKHTMQFSVGDEVVSVPQNEMDEFNSIAKQNNVTPEPIFSYRVSGKDMEPQEVEVPKSQYDEFAKVAADNGAKIEPLRHIVLDDGTEKTMSMRELRDFMRSDEYLNTPEGQVVAARRKADKARLAYEEKRAPGFWGELARGLFTAEGIRENAENSALAKPYAYANDLCNAIVGGLLKGSAKISEGFGRIVGSDTIVKSAQADQAAVDQALPTDMLDTSGGGAANKVLQVGKNVAAVTGEFAPAAIPGVGQAYAASLVGGGATVRFAQVYDDAIEHGVDPQRAVGLASLGAGVDALGNMLLMGKFKGVWSGEEKALADAAKRSLVRRLVGDTAKTGAIMSGQGMAGDVIDQAAEGNVWLDWKRTGKVGFEQFIEGGLFHLVNSGAHAATRIDWGREAKGIPDGAARDMMEAPEGRALIFANSPDAARSVFHARRRGEDVSRRMIRELGLPDSIARTVHERNAIGDRLMADYDAFKERVRTKMDDVQAEALADEIASRSDEGVNNPAFEKVWFKAVEQIKDATELDDPERRAAIVDEAVKSNLGKGEKLRLAKQVLEYNRQRQAEFEAERAARAEAEKSLSGQPEAAKPVIEAKIDPEGPDFAPETGAEAPAGAEKPVQPPEVAANPARGASVEGNPTNDTPPAPSAPTPVPVRPTASVTAETPEAAPKNPVEGVSDVVAAQKHLTAEGDLKDGDISAPVGQQIKVGDTQFKVEARDEASGTLTVSDADGGRYEIDENGEVKEINHGSDQGGSPESAGARAQETARVEAAQGNGEAGTDGNQGQADGGAPGAKGGGTDVGGVKPGTDEAKKSPQIVQNAQNKAVQTPDGQGNRASLSKTVTEVKPANTKANPAKVAKVAEKFNLHLTKAETEKMSRSKNGINTNLMKTYHDPDGHLVATDGRIIISTTHGFDKAKSDADKASGRVYPDWRKVIPDYDSLSNRSQVNPKAILAVAKEATKLARDTGNDPDRVFVRVKVGDNDCLLAAFNATKMAEAMDAAGMTELATDARKDYPVVAHSKTTDIVLMPFRISNAWDNDIVIDAQTGRLVHAPKFDRDEKTGRTFEENALDVSMKQRGTMRSDLERQIKDSDVYADILAVRSGAKTADQAAKDSLKGVADSELSSPRAEVEKARAEHYARFAAIKDDAELMNALHDYYRERKSIDNDNWRRNERDIEKFTKHVAAMKRIEELRDTEPEVEPFAKLLEDNKLTVTSSDRFVHDWQNNVLGKMLYMTGSVSDRAQYENALKAFKEIVGKREPERDSAGLVHGDLERVATDLLNKPFATDAERKYLWEYTGKPDTTAEKYGLEKWQEKKPVEDAAYTKWLHGLPDTPERRAEYEKSHKAEAPATADKPPMDAYLESLTPMQRGKVRKTLEKRYDYGGDDGVMSEGELVDKAASGKGSKIEASVHTTSGGKSKIEYFLNGNQITKTALDYARSRGVNVDENSLERAHEEIDIRYVRDKVVSVSKPDYSFSDAALAKRIGELEAMPTKSLDYRADLKNELKILRKVRDARIARQDWDEKDGQLPTETAGGKIPANENAEAKPGEAAERVVAGEAGLSRPVGAEGSGGKEPPAKGGEEVSKTTATYQSAVEAPFRTIITSADGKRYRKVPYGSSDNKYGRWMDVETNKLLDVKKDDFAKGKFTIDYSETMLGKKNESILFARISLGEKPTATADAANEVRDAQNNLYRVRFSTAGKKREDQARAEFDEAVAKFKKSIEDEAVSLEDLKAEAKKFDEEEQKFRESDVGTSQHHNWAISNAIRDEIARREGTEPPPHRNEWHPQGVKPEDPWMKSVREDKDAVALNKKYRSAKTDEERQALRAEFDKIVARHKAEWEKENAKPEPEQASRTPEEIAAAKKQFVEDVYGYYREEGSVRAGSSAIARMEHEEAISRVQDELKSETDAMEKARDAGTQAEFDKHSDRVEELKDALEVLNGMKDDVDDIDVADNKSESHASLRKLLKEINDVSPIPNYEDIGPYSRRDAKRSGVKIIDDANDDIDDTIGRIEKSGRNFEEDDDLVFDAAERYLDKEFEFSKDVYDKLTDGDRKYLDNLVREAAEAKKEVIETIYDDDQVPTALSKKFVEAHEAIGAFEESARKYHGLMRDEDGHAVLYTEKAHASAMASDAVSGVAKALAAKNRESGEAAMERMRMAVRNGGEFPNRKEVTEAAKLLPEELRKPFVKNMNEWRKWAEDLKEETPIADAASKAADDVDAAIEAEERGGATAAPAGAPVAAPRGSGTGTLPQDTPMSLGRGTGKRTIVTPQSFLKEAQRLFPDVAFRQKNTARMKTWAAGHFEPLDRIIRSRDMSAIRTLSHELGHDLEHLTRYDVLKSPAVKRDLSDLGHALYGPGVPKPPSYIGEGFAEYVRGYVCDAPNLHQVAPDLDTWFNGPFKKSHPEIVKKLDRLRDMVQTMKEQSAMEEIRGFRRPATTVVERAWKHVTDVFSGENWNDQASIILHGLKKSGMESLYHWQGDFRELEAAVKAGDAAKAASLAAKVNDKIANHPYLFPTITRGTASQRVMDMARHGTTSLLGNVRTGESLKDIFADFSKKEQEEWKDYAIARHGIANYYDKKLEFGLPREVLEATIRNYAPKAAKYEAALQRFTDYSHRVLHLGVDAGLISQETYDKIVADHPIYVRITRRYNEDGASARQGGGAAINRRTGGFDNILDPIDATLMDQEKYLRACFQAKTLQLIAQAARRGEAANLRSIKTNGGPNANNTHPHGEAHMAVGAYWPVLVPNAKEAVKFNSGKLGKELAKAKEDFVNRTGADAIPIEEFLQDLTEDNTSLLTIFRDKPSAGKHNLVSVYVDGDLQTYELPDMKWAKMLSDVYDKSEFSKLERGFGLATAGIRLGATTVNPGFAVRNGIRDSLHSAVMSETGAIPMLSTLNGMLHQLTGAESAQMFRSMGGHMSDLVGITKEQKWNHGGKVALAQNPLQTVAAYSPTDWLLMKPVVKAASDILSLPELGPRIREFEGVMQKCRKAGLDEDVCAMLAMSHAKDISIDFQRAGRYMKHINHFIPFSNAMWRGTEQTVRNLGLLPALPHQFEDRNAVRGAKNVGKGLAYVTSWMAALAMMEMSGDEEDKRRAFERSPVEKWEYAHMGDWRVPLPFETGYLFGALPKAVIYEMNGDEGAVKECLTYFNQAMPTKYLNPDTAVGSISLFTPWIGLLRNKDYRGRAIVPEHIMENRIKEDWYTQYTTELSKRLGKELGASPAQLEYLLDAYTGGLYRRLALGAENVGDTSRLKEGRGISILDTLRARPQANRLIEDFYRFGEEAKQRLGSGVISLEDYGKLAAQNAVKKTLTSRFDEMRTIRADKSIPMAEQDRLVGELSEKVNDTIREFNGRDDYRQRGIAYAASHLTGSAPDQLKPEDRDQYLALLKDVPRNEIVQALIKFGSEAVMVKSKGVEVPHQRWSNQNINERVSRLLMLMQ